MSCNICVSDFNKKTRVCLKCPFCDFDACRECNEKYILPKFRTDRVNGNQDLRIKYLLSEINQEKFKSLLQKRAKEHRKNGEISNILNMYLTCCTEIVYRYYEMEKENDHLRFKNTSKKEYDEANKKKKIEREEIRNELVELNNYANTCLQNVTDILNV